MATITDLIRRNELRRALESGNIELPVLPGSALEILNLTKDPDADIDDVELAVSKDPGFVVKMLKIVNSPLYATAREVKTIQEAIMLIGFKSLSTLALTVGSAKHLSLACPAFGHDANGLWRHSVAVAVAARTLAKELGWNAAACEEVYVAGLLHDIGKIVLEPYLSVARGEYDISGPGVDAELLGVGHEEAGELIATAWGLGPSIRAVVAGHEGSDCPDEHVPSQSIVLLADALTHDSAVGFRPGMNWPRPAPERALDALATSIDDLEGLRPTIEEAVGEGVASLQGFGS